MLNVAHHQVADKLANAIYKPLWIMTSHRDGELSGSLVISALSLYRSQPVKVVVCVTKHDYTHEVVMASRVFALHVLRPDQIQLAVHFAYQSSRNVDKFASLDYKIGLTGSPVLKDCLGYMEFEVLADVDTPTHTVVVAEVRNAEAYVPLEGIVPGAGVNDEW
ncbi:MAG TPA: flavin reductase family protein, partial [Chloroflexota bacterium]|nr:flavin reductase family protein [Chloroflexota bacterium]